MVEYDENYYKDEEIDGFHVTSMMKRYWAASLEVLLEIDRVCKKHNIKYFIVYGTLLGAIRHKGFIPWDDDIDIAMLREDYERFIDVATTEIRPPFIVENAHNSSCIHPCNINNGKIPHMDKEFLDRFHGCPYVAGVDVYKYDNISDNKAQLKEFGTIYMVVRYLAQRFDPLFDENKLPESIKDKIDHPEDEDLEEVLSGVETYFGIKIPRDETTHLTLGRMSDSLAQTFNGEKCSCVVNMNSIRLPSCTGSFFPREAFDDVIELEFQGFKLPAPAGYEKLLEISYGKDWRIPSRSGASHDYPVYRRQANNLEKLYNDHNITPPDYYYL